MCCGIFITFQGEGVQSQLLGVGEDRQDRPLVPCVSSLCSWKQDIREGMLDGQEARHGQPKPRGTADCQGLTESSGGWRAQLGKKQGLG